MEQRAMDEGTPRDPDRDEKRLSELRGEIATRLRPSCSHLSTPDFEELVERMARLQRKYEQQLGVDFLGHHRTDPTRRDDPTERS
jgi:hypothetical protein